MTGMSSDLFRIQKKEFVMQSVFGRQFGLGRTDRVARDRKAKSRRLQPSVDGLESRNLLSLVPGVTLSAGVLTIVPDATVTNNTAVVSYLTVGGVNYLDVSLNGNHTGTQFQLRQVGSVSFQGSGFSVNETFQNKTGVSTNAHGGSGHNTFIGGLGQDVFYGGSGVNILDAGTGYDVLVGGSGSNTYNALTGSGLIIERGSTTSVNDPPNANGSWTVI
jgi:hypothetical protein